MAQEAETLTADELRDAWLVLSDDERREGFQLLSRSYAEDLFLTLAARDQAHLIRGLDDNEQRLWLRTLAPDDVADLLQEVPQRERERLLGLLDETTRADVSALLAYAEDVAGGLMNPRFARVRPEMTVDEAIIYLRRQARGDVETVYYVYVLDASQRLLGVVSFRELLTAPPGALVADIMKRDVISAHEGMDQEDVCRVVVGAGLLALPVLDDLGHMKGVCTVDDIVDVVQEETTEDVQLMGGAAPLEVPYLDAHLRQVVRKRAGWLTVLLVGQMLTAAAMERYEGALASAVVLALFIPLVISSGGNSGSQASTLIIRSFAVGEVRMSDWWRVFRRELLAGATLGLLLGAVGALYVVGWELLFASFGERYLRLALTVFLSVLGVVSWGSVSGSMLPFLLRRLRLDPASASGPLVATLIDVTGLVFYFSLASLILL